MKNKTKSLFLSNKYTKWYYSIIKSSISKQDNLIGYYEKHHIIPKSLGGSDNPNNLVKLTAKEHFICHALLCRMCLNKNHYFKMLNAFQRMQTSNTNQKRYTSKLYEYFKKEISNAKSILMRGRKNPFYGKKHTKDIIDKIKKNRHDTSGINNPNFGNTWSQEQKDRMSKIVRNRMTKEYRKKLRIAQKNRPPISDETREKLSIAGIGRIFSEETKKKLSKQKTGEGNPNYGKVYTNEERQKMSNARKGKKISESQMKWAKISKCLNTCEKILILYGKITQENIIRAKKDRKLGKTCPGLIAIKHNLTSIPTSMEQIVRMRNNNLLQLEE